MTSLTLFGTLTSPFVRRVRIVAHEAGIVPEIVDTATEDGKARLHATSPIGKVPTAVVDGTVVWDSANIVDLLASLAHHEVLRPLPVSAIARARVMNTVHAVDEATASAIRLFYLDRDGVTRAGLFLDRESARIDSILAALEADAQVFDPRAACLGRAELALVTGLDWMRFRHRGDVTRFPALVGLCAALNERPSVRETAPV